MNREIEVTILKIRSRVVDLCSVGEIADHIQSEDLGEWTKEQKKIIFEYLDFLEEANKKESYGKL